MSQLDDALNEAVKPKLKQQIIELFLEIVGEDYKPSELENDTRWVRQMPPSSSIYTTALEAKTANWEFNQLREAINNL